MTDTAVVVNHLLERIAEDKENPPIFDVTAPLKTSVVGADGRYSNKDISGQEFFLKGIRAGKRSEWIIELQPVGGAVYVQAEISDKVMKEHFPTLEAYIVKLLGYSGILFKTAVRKFAAEFATKVEAEAREEEVGKYNSNPSWGSF